MRSVKIILLISLLSLFSCGDAKMETQTQRVSSANFLSCTLNTEAFENIFKADISNDLDCLNDSLQKFMELVRVDHAFNFLHKDKLISYMSKYQEGADEAMINIVDSIYDLSFLIFGGRNGYVSKAQVFQLIEFAKLFNKEMRIIYDQFNSDVERDYDTHHYFRTLIESAGQRMTNQLSSLMRLNREENDYINILTVIRKLISKNSPELYQNIEKNIYLKKLILGGVSEVLTYSELADLITKLPKSLAVIFDFTRQKKITLDEEQGDLYNLYLENLKTVKNDILNRNDMNDDMFSMDELVDLVDSFVDLDSFSFDVRKYKDLELLEIKDVFLGNSRAFMTKRDIFKIFQHAENVLEEGRYYARIYTEYKDYLESGCLISKTSSMDDIDPEVCRYSLSFDAFPANSKREIVLRDNFSRIIYNYKYFKGESASPFYSKKLGRNSKGVFEVSILEYLFRHVFEHYGHENPKVVGRYAITLDGENGIDVGIQNVLKKFYRILIDLEIIVPGRVKGKEWINAAENVMLLSTLFQNQANGGGAADNFLEVPEISEFFVGLLTSMEIRTYFSDEVLKRCPHLCDDEETPKKCQRVTVACFRDNFIQILETPRESDGGRAIVDYMPRLYKYLKESDKEEINYFLEQTEIFTRTCTHYDDAMTEEVPMAANDALAVFAGMLNVESTFLRFDVNGNNIMDANEVTDAYYALYKPAIIGMVKDMGIPLLDKLSKQIFQYLIKYKQIPKGKTIPHFLKFLISRKKQAPAYRSTIAAILRIIGETSPAGQDNPFQCELFREPDKL